MEGYTFVYAIDYGSNTTGTYLSPMGVSTTQRALRFLNAAPAGGRYALGFCGADLPDKGMVAAKALEWKGMAVSRELRRSVPLFPITARNSIDEAKNTKEALDAAGISPTRIILFCEWWHSWRVWLIWWKVFRGWRKIFRGCKIEVRRMRLIDSDDYILPLMRNKRQWAVYNLKALAAAVLWVCGFERVANWTQPTPRSQ